MPSSTVSTSTSRPPFCAKSWSRFRKTIFVIGVRVFHAGQWPQVLTTIPPMTRNARIQAIESLRRADPNVRLASSSSTSSDTMTEMSASTTKISPRVSCGRRL